MRGVKIEGGIVRKERSPEVETFGAGLGCVTPAMACRKRFGSRGWLLARVLEETAPGKCRATAVGAARDLLLNPVANPYRGPIDQSDRNHLYAVLELFNDRSVAELAGTQLVQPDGSLDYNALRMLKESMKERRGQRAEDNHDDPMGTYQLNLPLGQGGGMRPGLPETSGGQRQANLVLAEQDRTFPDSGAARCGDITKRISLP